MTAEPVRDDDPRYDLDDLGYRGRRPSVRTGTPRTGARRSPRAEQPARRRTEPRRTAAAGTRRTEPPRRTTDDRATGRRAGTAHRDGADGRDTTVRGARRGSARAGTATATGRAETGARRSTPPAPVALPRTPFVLLVLALVAAGIVGLLVLNTAINTSSLTVQRLRGQQSTLDAQEQQLNQELADLKSPGSLQAAATRMGLVPAGRTAFIRLPDGKVIGVPQPVSATGDQ